MSYDFSSLELLAQNRLQSQQKTMNQARSSKFSMIVYNFESYNVVPIYHDLVNDSALLPPSSGGDVEIFTQQLGMYLIGGLSKHWYKRNSLYELPVFENPDYRMLVTNVMNNNNIFNICLFVPISILEKMPSTSVLEDHFLSIIGRYASNYQLNKLNQEVFESIRRDLLAVIAKNFISSKLVSRYS